MQIIESFKLETGLDFSISIQRAKHKAKEKKKNTQKLLQNNLWRNFDGKFWKKIVQENYLKMCLNQNNANLDQIGPKYKMNYKKNLFVTLLKKT